MSAERVIRPRRGATQIRSFERLIFSARTVAQPRHSKVPAGRERAPVDGPSAAVVLLRDEAIQFRPDRGDGRVRAILRSPYAHAKIVSIDTSEALAVDGVATVLTGAEAVAQHPSRRQGVPLSSRTSRRKSTSSNRGSTSRW